MGEQGRTLKRRNILLMILFTILTLGVYLPMWYLRRRAALNGLDSPQKIPLWPILALIAYIGANFILGVIDAPLPLQDEDRLDRSPVFIIVELGVTIAIIWQNFRVKDIIEDHLTRPATEMPSLVHESVTLSWPLTFLLGMFYLQHAINRNLEALTRMPDSAAAGSAL